PADGRFGPHPIPVRNLATLQATAANLKTGFLCSVFDQQTLEDYLVQCAPKRVKIASPELTDHQLLRACGNAGLHVILSTGMSTEQQISEAVRVIEETGSSATLLQCVSTYPA